MSVLSDSVITMSLSQVLRLRTSEGVYFCRLHDQYEVLCDQEDPTFGPEATVADLIPAKRRHENYLDILRKIEIEGQRSPVFVCPYNVLHDGHHRVAALAELGRDVLVYREHEGCPSCATGFTRTDF